MPHGDRAENELGRSGQRLRLRERCTDSKTSRRFATRFRCALTSAGPHFIRARVEALDPERPPKTKHVPDPRENKYQFASYIEKTEGVQILGSGLGNFG